MFDKIKAFFSNSATILFARVQLAIGAIWTVLVATDLGPVLQGKYLTYWLIVSGVITEIARRRTLSKE